MIAARLQRLSSSSSCCSCRLGMWTVARLLSSSPVTTAQARANIPAGFAKIKEKQKMFNVDNGLR